MIIVRTEIWSTKSGKIAKAVVRDEKGKLIGATNNTKVVNFAREKVVGKR